MDERFGICRYRHRSCVDTHSFDQYSRDQYLGQSARSTGPAIFVGGWALSQLWLFWVAPIIGALLAGWTYLWLGEEDPSRRAPIVGERPPS